MQNYTEKMNDPKKLISDHINDLEYTNRIYEKLLELEDLTITCHAHIASLVLTNKLKLTALHEYLAYRTREEESYV